MYIYIYTVFFQFFFFFFSVIYTPRNHRLSSLYFSDFVPSMHVSTPPVVFSYLFVIFVLWNKVSSSAYFLLHFPLVASVAEPKVSLFKYFFSSDLLSYYGFAPYRITRQIKILYI